MRCVMLPYTIQHNTHTESHSQGKLLSYQKILAAKFTSSSNNVTRVTTLLLDTEQLMASRFNSKGGRKQVYHSVRLSILCIEYAS